MNRRQLKDLAEAIGFIGLVTSLVFVGIESRNSTKQSALDTQALEIAAYQALMSDIDDINTLMLESPTAAAVMSSVWNDEDTDPEIFQRDRVLYTLFRHGDLAYFMYERGAIDEARLLSALDPVPIYTDVGREFRNKKKGAFTENYRNYVDRLVARAVSGNVPE